MPTMIPIYSVSSQADIARRAQELHEAAGRPEHRDLEFWLQAEGEHLQMVSSETANCTATEA